MLRLCCKQYRSVWKRFSFPLLILLLRIQVQRGYFYREKHRADFWNRNKWKSELHTEQKQTERDELKVKIRQYQEELSEIENLRTSKEQFTLAVRKFMQMETLTPALLNELIEKIEVHSIEGKGKNKTQRIVIHYRFIGVIENPVKEENIVLEARQGVAVEYLTA